MELSRFLSFHGVMKIFDDYKYWCKKVFEEEKVILHFEKLLCERNKRFNHEVMFMYVR